MKRIGMLTSGGDCQSLNATMRGVAKSLYNMYGDEVEIYGFSEGYKGLMYKDFRIMKPRDFAGILTEGGTILGTSRQPFKLMRVPTPEGMDKVAAMKDTYYKLRLDCLVVLGGNGSQKTANLLSEEGLNVIGLPKTIDNDLWGTDMTFGFQSAVDIATNAIDCIHTTAASHGRVFIVEIMGHKVGWLTLHAGIAGGADIILLPEIPYDINSIAAALDRRTAEGKRFSIVAVAEGAISKEDAALSKKDYKKKVASRQYPSIAYEVGAQIAAATGQEVRVTVPGHTQRGGGPCAYDRVLSTRLGAAAGKMIDQGEFGYLVGIKNNEITKIPLSDVAGKLKKVEPDCSLIQEAKLIGINFGD
ncbi:MAG: 6-phosphofructokinase [Lachnospiraceae bacterium]